MKKFIFLLLICSALFYLGGCNLFSRDAVYPADVNLGDKRGTPPLIHAIEQENVEIIEALIEKGANVNSTDSREKPAVVKAAQLNNIEIIELLIENNVDLNVKDYYGNTPLLVAIENNRTDIVELLLSAGAEDETDVEEAADEN